jgi:hypothetical protein
MKTSSKKRRPHHQQFGAQAPVTLDGHDLTVLADKVSSKSEKIGRETDFM